jgi:hypothetical protein
MKTKENIDPVEDLRNVPELTECDDQTLENILGNINKLPF